MALITSAFKQRHLCRNKKAACERAGGNLKDKTDGFLGIASVLQSFTLRQVK